MMTSITTTLTEGMTCRRAHLDHSCTVVCEYHAATYHAGRGDDGDEASNETHEARYPDGKNDDREGKTRRTRNT